ncbi:ATP-dependent DNA helicase [Mariprofundus ferrooxydans]|uniref:DNA 5'-3' helicase n=1 Tax=Mariprofundus ferrooxydans PV-1 TaxID=314345 RepID=Q0F3T0_9PROT|nr:ATP-dependent DNA helicase [Mariprofundus ferrooxydans]EAU55861.1 ATP-dependent helicase [Mariprofundus ferrooxydans PV-1]KON48144.1 ATP-dependent helicase [Mariprofundus ferrooxydans]
MGDLGRRVSRDFERGGLLDEQLPGYGRREEQIKLAGEIAGCIVSGSRLLAEAETGTGKTLAYLIPALRSSDKVLISTHTRSLQDQLVHRDLPAVQKALGAKRRVALLKGRSNYLCPQRLKTHISSPQVELWAQKTMLKVLDWSRKTQDGDLAALPFDPFAKGIGAMITATADQCAGSKCAEFEHCPLMKARQKAQGADIVVTNHSLLLADAALKSGDFGEVLPAFDVYVLDEAHSLPQLAGQHFGIQLTRMNFIQWLNDMQAELEAMGDEPALKKDIVEQGRVVLEAWLESGLEALEEAWGDMLKLSDLRRERSEPLTRLAERAEQLAEEIAMVKKPGDGFVGWSEGEGELTRYTVAPVETGPVLAKHLWSRQAAFILLSATLRVSGSFDYARNRLGLADAEECFHPSPFDYAQQAMIYLPRHMPDSRSPGAVATMTDEIETLLRASRGRAFVLFTAWSMLKQVAPELARRLPWDVLIQGESGSRDAILDAFRADTHSVLCGTRSFWEGVDVPGESLSMVIIDKMPFAPPNDPLLQARIRRCEEQGGSGFRDIQLPEAIATLRQGAGRLIRSEDDRGVMALLDSRLYHKAYGREAVHNLPPAPIRDDLADVRWFFEEASE